MDGISVGKKCIVVVGKKKQDFFVRQESPIILSILFGPFILSVRTVFVIPVHLTATWVKRSSDVSEKIGRVATGYIYTLCSVARCLSINENSYYTTSVRQKCLLAFHVTWTGRWIIKSFILNLDAFASSHNKSSFFVLLWYYIAPFSGSVINSAHYYHLWCQHGQAWLPMLQGDIITQ